jgi:hypothetical protein
MLPNYAIEFWPRYDKPTPQYIKKIIDHLCVAKFGADYDPDSGIIRVSRQNERLKGEYSEVKPELLADPHINFFFKSNPNHYLGHELACLMKIDIANLNQYAREIIKNQ